MKKIVYVLVFLCVVAIVISPKIAAASWCIETVDSTGSVDRSSLALDSDGKAHISYYDANGPKYTTNKSGAWVTESAGGSGSLALDSYSKAHISYSDYANRDLKYAYWEEDGDCIFFNQDNCPYTYNPFQEDIDEDTIGDTCDNCPTTSNPDQADQYPPQGNSIGDACECEGNFDCDGDVDGTDAAKFKWDFGRGEYYDPCTDDRFCYGDFDCDVDVDGTDAALFKEDFGRSTFSNPCPACEVGEWCVYP